MPYWLEKLFHLTADTICAIWPRSTPDANQLRTCKIVSHRGEHDGTTIIENTLAAFDAAAGQGVWGIELDIRWTADLIPVIFHDQDLQRIFGSPTRINDTTFADLGKEAPLIPSLEEVIRCYGKKLHLMAEIKAEDYPDPANQKQTLSRIFSDLTPGEDYHFLTLQPSMFRYVDFVPPSTYIAVAQLNLKEMSGEALQKGYGGVAGHYLFMKDELIRTHKTNQQEIGTGYISSKNCVFREINRGVDWIFSNQAVKIQQIVNRALNSKPDKPERA